MIFIRSIQKPALVYAALGLVLAVAAIYLASRWLSPPVPVNYLTAKVVRGDLESAVLATGTLQAYKQVDVGAQVSGQLKALKVELGQQVRKGQLIAEIDPILSENSLRASRASMDSLGAQRQAAQAGLWQAELALKRQQDLIAKEATSRQEVEAAKAQVQVIKANIASFDAQIRQAKTQVDSAQASLAYTRIEAPMDGEVAAVLAQEGQTLVAAQQAPVLLKLANRDRMTVRAQISEADVMRVAVGQAAYFTILGNAERRYTGSLRAVEPAPQEYPGGGPKTPGPVYYNAVFDVPNDDHALRIAMTAKVAIVLKRAAQALSIPTSALGARDEAGRYAVRVMGTGQAPDTRQVAIGINNHLRVEVVDGLKEGDEVVMDEAPAAH
jgi:macrolide-specific efflux system membrane fusion protein